MTHVLDWRGSIVAAQKTGKCLSICTSGMHVPHKSQILRIHFNICCRTTSWSLLQQVLGDAEVTAAEKDRGMPKQQISTPNSVDVPLLVDDNPVNDSAVGQAIAGVEQQKTRSKGAIQKPREVQKNTKQDESEETEGSLNVNLLVDSIPRKMVACGSIVNAEFDLDTAVLPCGPQQKLIKLKLRKVFWPLEPLACAEVDGDGKLRSATLGEAMRREGCIWWPAPLELQD